MHGGHFTCTTFIGVEIDELLCKQPGYTGTWVTIWHHKNNVHGEHEKYRTGACSIAILELQEQQKIP